MSAESKDNPIPKTSGQTLPSHVFIDQGPKSYQTDHSRIVASQARRFQSAGKRRQQRVAARLDAGYARSLVGWRSTASTPADEHLPRGLSPSHRFVDQGSPQDLQDQQARREETNHCQAEMRLSIEVGLRVDPFSAFPSSNSRSVMYVVDYRTYQRPKGGFWLYSP